MELGKTSVQTNCLSFIKCQMALLAPSLCLVSLSLAGEGSSDAQIALVPALRQGQEGQLLFAAVSATGDTPGGSFEGDPFGSERTFGMLWTFLARWLLFCGHEPPAIQQELLLRMPQQLREGLQAKQSLQGLCQRGKQSPQHHHPVSHCCFSCRG